MSSARIKNGGFCRHLGFRHFLDNEYCDTSSFCVVCYCILKSSRLNKYRPILSAEQETIVRNLYKVNIGQIEALAKAIVGNRFLGSNRANSCGAFIEFIWYKQGAVDLKTIPAFCC